MLDEPLCRSLEQVADVLDCAAGNVNRYNAQALAALQAVLGEVLADPGSASGPGREQTKSKDKPPWMKPPCGSCWTAP